MDAREMECRLEALECPMKWNPERDSPRSGIDEMISNFEEDLKEFYHFKVETYSLLAYMNIKSFPDHHCDLAKAEEYVNMAIREKEQGDQAMEKDIVPLALMAHIYFKRQEMQLCEETIKCIEEKQANKTRKSEAFIIGLRAFCVWKFGPQDVQNPSEKCEIALQLFTEASNLDPDNPSYLVGIGLNMNRIRRNKSIENNPTQDEVEVWKKANSLTHEKDPTILINFASALWFHTSYDIPNAMASKALLLAKTGYVYLRCAIYYQQAKQFDSVHSCLTRGEQMPGNTTLLNKAGMFYWTNKYYKDLERAEIYLKRSFKESPGQLFFWGEMNYRLFSMEQDPEYNPMGDFAGMLEKYQMTQRRAKIYLEMGTYLYTRKADKGQALINFKKALKLDPSCHERVNGSQEHKGLSVIEMFDLVKDCLSDIDALLLNAWVMKTTQPAKLEESKQIYQQVLEEHGTIEEACVGLWKVNMEMGKIEESLLAVEKFPDGMASRTKHLIESKFHLAINKNDNEDEALRLYMDCVKSGCQNACAPALGLLKNVPVTTERLADVFEDCAHMLLCCERGTDFKFIYDPLSINTDKVLHADAKADISEILYHADPSIQNLRRHRLNMNMHQAQKMRYDCEDMSHSVASVMTSARDCLDRSMCELFEKHFLKCKCGSVKDNSKPCSCKSSAYYPYKFETKEELSSLLAKRGFQNFSSTAKGKFSKLFEFIWENSKANNPHMYGWIPDWCEMVNTHKHNKVLEAENLFEVANKAADFAEMVVIEIRNYI